jgi:hypothetical protein
MAPSKMNKTSLPDFKVSTEITPYVFCIIMGNIKTDFGH